MIPAGRVQHLANVVGGNIVAASCDIPTNPDGIGIMIPSGSLTRTAPVAALLAAAQLATLHSPLLDVRVVPRLPIALPDVVRLVAVVLLPAAALATLHSQHPVDLA